MNREIVIFVTTSSTEEAEKIARKLVEEKLVACVNIISDIRSIFFWESEICQEKEALMILKSVQEHTDQIIETVKSLHSYSVPEIIALPIIKGSKEYLTWVHEVTQR